MLENFYTLAGGFAKYKGDDIVFFFDTKDNYKLSFFKVTDEGNSLVKLVLTEEEYAELEEEFAKKSLEEITSKQTEVVKTLIDSIFSEDEDCDGECDSCDKIH